jgi:hypothetical protein
MSNLDLGVKDVAFEAKVFNRYGTFDYIANRNMEDLGYAYLYCDLLDKATLIIVTFKVKLSHIDMHEQYLKKGMFVKVKVFNIESKFKRGFEKDDMHVVIIVESMTIVSPIIVFEP